MLDEIRRYIRREQLLTEDRSVCVGVSGGMDSMVLLHVLRALGHPCSVAHVDHGLRGTESEEDAAFVEAHCHSLAIPFRTHRVDVGMWMKEHGGSVQIAARELRYAWLRGLHAENAMPIALAHHSDDAVETLFINLFRGTGLHGWSSIDPRNGAFIRPLLCVDRDAIEAYAQKHAIVYREDSSNKDPKYLRNRIRHELMPLLDDLRAGARGTIARSLDMLRGLESVGQVEVDRVMRGLVPTTDGSITIPFERIEGSPVPALVLFGVLRGHGFHPDAIERIHDAIGERATGAVFTAGDRQVSIDRHALILGAVAGELPTIAIDPNLSGGSANGFRWSIEEGSDIAVPNDLGEALLDADRSAPPLELRPWKAGDRIRPVGLGGSKLVSDILTDAKVPVLLKQRAYVLTCNGEVVWLVGHRIAEGFQAMATSRRVLRIVSGV